MSADCPCPSAAEVLPDFRHVRKYNALAARCGLSQMAEIVFSGGFYWLTKAQQCEGPYCPHCYEQDDVTIRLVSLDRLRACPRCGRRLGRAAGTDPFLGKPEHPFAEPM